MVRFNRKTWNQFTQIALPYWTSKQKWTPISLSFVLVVLLLAYTNFAVMFNHKLGSLASALAARDVQRFWFDVRVFLLLLLLAIPISAFYYYVRDKLAILWRRWLTTRFLGDYFARRAYYNLNADAAIDNPDQRIAEDINTFTQRSLQFLLITTNGLMQLLAFSVVLWSLSRVLVGILIVYAFVSTFTAIFAFGRGLTILNYLQLKKEADFRFSLVRVRENAEAIAFYQGEKQERDLVSHRFAKAFINYNKLIWCQLFLSMFQYANSYAAYLLPYAILAPAILAGELEVGAVIEAAGAFAACLVALNLVVDNFDSLSKFAAGISRLDSCREALDKAAAGPDEAEAIQSAVGDQIKLDHVTIKIPRQDRVLIEDLSVTVAAGEHLLISGPSGCGKTSLLRAIMGLWNHGTGTIERPKLADLLFLPQRPYMIPGSLKSQLLYPRLDTDASDDELREKLAAVQLPHLIEAQDALSVEADWSKVLSVGELQRLSLARLLLIKPKYAFLDEATSALDQETQEKIYQLARDTGTTLVSISHHASVRHFHTFELSLTGDGSWKIEPISRRRRPVRKRDRLSSAKNSK